MLMVLSKVTRNFQITVPADIRRKLHIHVGSFLGFCWERGMVVLRPQSLIDEEQAWFWSKEWQESEKEVDRARRKGHTRIFKSVKKMKNHFEK